jgi:hypothetical protein
MGIPCTEIIEDKQFDTYRISNTHVFNYKCTHMHITLKVDNITFPN